MFAALPLATSWRLVSWSRAKAKGAAGAAAGPSCVRYEPALMPSSPEFGARAFVQTGGTKFVSLPIYQRAPAIPTRRDILVVLSSNEWRAGKASQASGPIDVRAWMMGASVRGRTEIKAGTAAFASVPSIWIVRAAP